MIHHVKASSFADPKDIEAFRRAKARGLSDREAFKYGDNGIGYWGDDTTEGSGPCCALPPEDMVETWGSVSKAHNKQVDVGYGGVSVICLVKDTMPHRANITNGAGIDLNADAVRYLGFEPPMLEDGFTWEEVTDEETT